MHIGLQEESCKAIIIMGLYNADKLEYERLYGFLQVRRKRKIMGRIDFMPQSWIDWLGLQLHHLVFDNTNIFSWQKY